MTQIIWTIFHGLNVRQWNDALFIRGTSAVRIIVLVTGFQAVKKPCMNSNLITAIVSAGIYNMEAFFCEATELHIRR